MPKSVFGDPAFSVCMIIMKITFMKKFLSTIIIIILIWNSVTWANTSLVGADKLAAASAFSGLEEEEQQIRLEGAVGQPKTFGPEGLSQPLSRKEITIESAFAGISLDLDNAGQPCSYDEYLDALHDYLNGA